MKRGVSPEVLNTALTLLSKYQVWLLWLLPLVHSLTHFIPSGDDEPL